LIKASILTISDKGSRGERKDESATVIRETLVSPDIEIVKYEIVPDERGIISGKLIQWSDELGVDIIITTGGTGLSPRDTTPEATLDVIDRLAPGFAEAMRIESLKVTPMAMLSRAVSGIRGKTLIINLPGSPKAARENLEVLLPALSHGLAKLAGDPSDCGQG